jgi:N-acyl-D-aspartate/D-glutamate deacylase
LTREKFAKYRQQRGLVVIHSNTEERVRSAILSPLTMIASDGFDVKPGEGHPRSAGTYSRVLSKYVRQEKALPLPDAIRKMTLMPAQRLERRVPAMRNKGRIRVGADADVVVFDPKQIQRSRHLRETVRVLRRNAVRFRGWRCCGDGWTPGQRCASR